METREYKCSFGIVKVTIDCDQCNGTYQKNGEFTGTIDGNIVKAKWNNEGQEGLIELDLSDDKLTGKWKQGLDEGPMRGKWQGVRFYPQELTSFGSFLSDSDKKRFEEKEKELDESWGCVESEMDMYIELSKEIWEASEGKENKWVTSILKKIMSAVLIWRSVSGAEDKSTPKKAYCVSQICLAFFEMEGLIPVENNEQILNYFFDCIVKAKGGQEEWDNYLYDLKDFEKAPNSIIKKVEDMLKTF